MSETLQKLTPDRDLQCYFYHPSAIAALSGASSTGFDVSGTWRQQFDWAVVEWNRDNVFEHPAFRNLPDGDLSGLTLSYEETRTNCIPLDSDLYPTVDWPFLRVWAGPDGAEDIYYVKLADYSTAIAGSYACAFADFTLSGTISAGCYVGIANASEHFTYQLLASDTLASAVTAVRDSINAFSTTLKATSSGETLRVYYTGGTSIAASHAGANGNRVGVYSYVSGTTSLAWDAEARTLSGGTSPTGWRVSLDFSNLVDRDSRQVPMDKVRKMRWTYAADLQSGEFQRSEFQVAVRNWTVTGARRAYAVAGPGSVRVDSAQGHYTGTWVTERGNYSGGSIYRSTAPGSTASFTYSCDAAHGLFVGLRSTGSAAVVSIVVDGGSPSNVSLRVSGEDFLRRIPVASLTAGTHTVTLAHASTEGGGLWIDYVEAAVPSNDLPTADPRDQLTLATDWDTDHSLALPPERTAWMLDALGFRGRANHYCGALWFYELVASGYTFASATLTFSGTAVPSSTVSLTVSGAVVSKLVHVGDSPALIATAFAQEINRGYTGVWASVAGAVLAIHARAIGASGNSISLSCTSTDANLSCSVSATHLTGGVDGEWFTDLSCSPALNRAVRDWSKSYYAALHVRGIDCAAAFSLELGNGDPSTTAGVAQRGPSGDPILLPTPSLQTNFSPTSLAYWKRVYREMAQLQADAGLTPYLQFGEVQWWYFPNDGLGHNYSGMPFYDAWTTSEFQAQFGRTLPSITNNSVSVTTYSAEAGFFSGLVGSFTSAIQSWVRAEHPTCRFEVLYPTDVNQTAFNQAINFPSVWNTSTLDVLKCESFGFTLGRNLDKAEETIQFGSTKGFPAAKRSHLLGIGDATVPWWKEAKSAMGKRLESIVLFALDQFCLIGYSLPTPTGLRRSQRS